MKPTNVAHALRSSAVESACPADAGAPAELLKRVEALFGNSQSFTEPETRRWAPAGPINGVPEHEVVARFQRASLPAAALSPEEYREFLALAVTPHAVNTASPMCFAHMSTASPAFIKELQVVIAEMNQNLVKFEASRSLTYLERQTLAILHRLVFGRGDSFYAAHGQNPQSVLGIAASGATVANLTALWIARNKCLAAGGDGECVEHEGVALSLRRLGFTGAVIVGSRLMHYSIQKAAGLLGLGEGSVVTAPTDSQGRIELGHCRRLIRECEQSGRRVLAIIGVAGTTNCGSMDPLDELAELAREHDTHLHVDAAWGAPLLFSSAQRGLLAGIEKADTVTIDGHKQFYVPIGVGMLLLKDPVAARIIEKRSNYMLQHGTLDLGHQSIEGSRPASALLLHAALSVIGPEGLGLLVDENVKKARYLARRIEEMDDFELLMKPTTNIVLYRYVPSSLRPPSVAVQTAEQCEALNRFNERLQRAQFESGCSLVSRTTTQLAGTTAEITALRAVVANPLCREHHLDDLLSDQRRIAAQLLAFGPVPIAPDAVPPP